MEEIIILAIDTSCDETSVSVTRGLTVLSNIQPSQMEYHKKYGGVVPSLAKLAHQERIDNVVEEALKRAQVKEKDIDVFAVTYGPGLAIALEIGIIKAKELALRNKKPLIAINHMEGHLLSALAKPRRLRNSRKLLNRIVKVNSFPSIGFLISGGHTELILVKGFGEYEKIGETLDDSCGEAYDKCGRIMGLGYPAGPIITEFAKRHRSEMEVSIVKNNQSTLVRSVNKRTGSSYSLPIAMVNSGDLNFSYSGLKTAFKQLVEGFLDRKISHTEELSGDIKGLSKEQVLDLCVSFEAAAVAQLTIKLKQSIKKYSPKEVWLGGGVIASAKLRAEVRKVCNENNISLFYPYSKKLTGDNAAMIAVAAFLKLHSKNRITHNPKEGIFLKDFDQIDREPSLSL